MATDAPYPQQHLFPAVAVPLPQGIPTEGPASHPEGPPSRPYPYELHQNRILYPQPSASSSVQMPPPGRVSPQQFAASSSNPTELYIQAQQQSSQPPLPSPPSPTPDQGGAVQGGAGANHYPSSSGVPRLPPILQVEKQQVTTSATQLASASRRRNEAHFVCPVPGCGSTFTRRFNLRGTFCDAHLSFTDANDVAAGHLRSHTEERPYVCEWPGCKKGFARQHDCKYVLLLSVTLKPH